MIVSLVRDCPFTVTPLECDEMSLECPPWLNVTEVVGGVGRVTDGYSLDP